MGAWGVEPFQNDSALDWLSRIQREVERAFKPALKSPKKQKVRVFVGPPRVITLSGGRKAHVLPKAKLVERLTLPGHCQHDALAAVQLVLALPELQRLCLPPNYTETLAQCAERVLLNLKQDEAFVGAWVDHSTKKKYIAVLDRELGRVREVLAGQRREHELVVKRHVLRIRKMSEAERRKIAAGKFYKSMTYSPTFCEAFKRVTGKDVPEGTLGGMPKNPRRRPRPAHTKKTKTRR